MCSLWPQTRRLRPRLALRDGARAAVATGADDLLVEAHPNEDQALTDGAQSPYDEKFQRPMYQLRIIVPAVGLSLGLPWILWFWGPPAFRPEGILASAQPRPSGRGLFRYRQDLTCAFHPSQRILVSSTIEDSASITTGLRSSEEMRRSIKQRRGRRNRRRASGEMSP